MLKQFIEILQRQWVVASGKNSTTFKGKEYV